MAAGRGSLSDDEPSNNKEGPNGNGNSNRNSNGNGNGNGILLPPPSPPLPLPLPRIPILRFRGYIPISLLITVIPRVKRLIKIADPNTFNNNILHIMPPSKRPNCGFCLRDGNCVTCPLELAQKKNAQGRSHRQEVAANDVANNAANDANNVANTAANTANDLANSAANDTVNTAANTATDLMNMAANALAVAEAALKFTGGG